MYLVLKASYLFFVLLHSPFEHLPLIVDLSHQRNDCLIVSMFCKVFFSIIFSLKTLVTHAAEDGGILNLINIIRVFFGSLLWSAFGLVSHSGLPQAINNLFVLICLN